MKINTYIYILTFFFLIVSCSPKISKVSGKINGHVYESQARFNDAYKTKMIERDTSIASRRSPYFSYWDLKTLADVRGKAMLKNNLLPKKNGVIFIMEEKSGQGYVGTMWGDCKSVNYTVQDLLGEKQKFDLKYQILEYDEGWNSMKKLVGTWEVEKVIKEHEKSIVLDGGSLLATKVVIKNGKVASALSFSFYPW